jgi:hypothetical protein
VISVRKKISQKRLTEISIAIAVLGLFFGTGLIWRLDPSLFTPKPFAAIIYPTEFVHMNTTETVNGTSGNIPAGDVIWVVTKASDCDQTFPQSSAVDMQSGGNWSSTVWIGGSARVGVSYKITAVLADANTQNAYNQWVIKSKATNNWQGLPDLFGGKELCSVNVIPK